MSNCCGPSRKGAFYRLSDRGLRRFPGRLRIRYSESRADFRNRLEASIGQLHLFRALHRGFSYLHLWSAANTLPMQFYPDFADSPVETPILRFFAARGYLNWLTWGSETSPKTAVVKTN